MKNKKPRIKSSVKTSSKKTEKGRTFDSLAAAAGALKLPLSLLKSAKLAGCPAFRSNRVYETELLHWLSANPLAAETGNRRDKKLDEEIRKLRMANDTKAGTLIQRAFVVQRIQRAAGEINAYRLRSETEHPKLFAATNGDIALCRTRVRQIWDEIMRAFGNLAKHFDES